MLQQAQFGKLALLPWNLANGIQMIRLLRMIMTNLLGHQDTKQFKQFTLDEEHLNESTSWGKETMKGMET